MRIARAAAAFTTGAAAMGVYRSRKPWRETSHTIFVSGEERATLRIRERRSPPPIGAMLWPAAHTLLHYMLESVPPGAEATVLELGSGCGLTAIGLGLAAPRGCVRSVIATDCCAESLANCEANVARNGASQTVRVLAWDVTHEPPCDVRAVTHLIAADVVYHGASGQQLVDRLAWMVEQNPRLEIALILVDRFSGGAVAGMSAMAGVPNTTVTASALDPAIEAFERAAADAGLELQYEPMGEGVARGLTDSLPLAQRMRWLALGTWDAMRLYRLSPAR
jgi:predicted nicotinamide N-methyase